MEEIRITLETLYDILRNEKKREDLQKVNETFFLDVVGYVREKLALLENKKDDDDLFAAGERDKLEYELRSIKRILKEIYEKREKKLIDIALNRSRTQSDIIDTSAMLREEKNFYDQLVDLFDGYRKGVLLNLFAAKIPEIAFNYKEIELPKEPKHVEEPAPHSEDDPDIFSQPDEKPEETGEDLPEPEVNPESKEEPGINPPLTEETGDYVPERLKKIKFIHAVPSFIWKDLKEYGPYEEGDEAELDELVADLIIKKERAVEIN